jgi:O-antigen/teichoic acid export membrane protein
LLAKSYFSIEHIGSYELFLFISSAVTFFWTTGLLQSLIPLTDNSNAYSNKKNDKKPELFNATIVVFIFSLIASASVLIYQLFISERDASNSSFLKLLMIYTFTLGPSFLAEYFHLILKQNIRLVIYGITSNFLLLFIVSISLFIEVDIHSVFIILIIFNVLKIIWAFIILKRHAEFVLNFPFIKEYIRVGYPLIISTLLSGSAQYIDSLIVKSYFDSSQFAIFRYGARELPISVLIANSFSSAVLTNFTSNSNLSDILKKIKQFSTLSMHVLFPFSIVILFCSHLLFPIIFSPAFAESATIFNVYILLIISRLIFPQTILTGLKKTKYILQSSVLEITVNITLSLLFINYFGLVGIAYATVVAYLIDKLYLIIVLKKKFMINVSDYVPINIIFLYSSLLLICYYISDFLLT